MTPDELDQIQRRCDAATAGPWIGVGGQIYAGGSPSPGRGAENILNGANFVNNLLFVIEVRTDVPRLLAEVKRLRAWLQIIEETNPSAIDANTVARMALSGKGSPNES